MLIFSHSVLSVGKLETINSAYCFIDEHQEVILPIGVGISQ
jgi:hypothetical protein